MENINSDSKKDSTPQQAKNFQLQSIPQTVEAKKDNSNNNATNPAKIKKEKRLTVFEYIMVCVNILLVLLTAILAWANGHIAKDSNLQIDKMKQYIVTAESSNVIAKQNMITANTPYISISVIKADMPIVVGKVIALLIQYKNVGKTPALDFRPLPIINYESKNYFSEPKPISPNIAVGKFILMPGDVFVKECDSRILTDTLVSAIKSEIWNIYIVSVVNYRDIFGRNFQVTQRLEYFAKAKRFYPDDKGNEYKQY